MDSKEYICEKCNYKTVYKQSYKAHLKTELHLTGHRKTRTDKKTPDKCPHCLYTTGVSTTMQQHIIKNHMTPDEQKEKLKYYCDVCKIGFMAQSQYNVHTKSKRHQNKILYMENK